MGFPWKAYETKPRIAVFYWQRPRSNPYPCCYYGDLKSQEIQRGAGVRIRAAGGVDSEGLG